MLFSPAKGDAMFQQSWKEFIQALEWAMLKLKIEEELGKKINIIFSGKLITELLKACCSGVKDTPPPSQSAF